MRNSLALAKALYLYFVRVFIGYTILSLIVAANFALGWYAHKELYPTQVTQVLPVVVKSCPKEYGI